MKTLVCLSLLLSLTACAAPGPTIGESGLPTDSPLKPSPQPAISSTLVQPTAAPTAVKPGASPKFDSSALLLLRNETHGRYELHRVDPTTGKDMPGYAAIVFGERATTQDAQSTALSTDGKKLAIVVADGEYCHPTGGGTACLATADVLHLIDLRNWSEVTATLPGKGWAWPISFSPDAARLALIYSDPKSSGVMLFDTSAARLMAQRGIAFEPWLLRYAQDSTSIQLYGQPSSSDPWISKPESPRVVLMDARTLDVKWDQPLPNIISGTWCVENCQSSHDDRLLADWTPAVALAPDGRKLYIVHADEEKLTTVDFVARTVRNVDIQAAGSWIDRLLALTAGVAEAKGEVQGAFKQAVLSPDGTRLYVIGRTMNAVRDAQGNWQGAETSLGLQVIEVESSHKIASRDSTPGQIRITPDGAYLLVLGGWGEQCSGTEVLDASTLRSVACLTQWEVGASERMDGQPIIVASQHGESGTKLAVLAPGSFDIIHSWSVNTYASWMTAP